VLVDNDVCPLVDVDGSGWVSVYGYTVPAICVRQQWPHQCFGEGGKHTRRWYASTSKTRIKQRAVHEPRLGIRRSQSTRKSKWSWPDGERVCSILPGPVAVGRVDKFRAAKKIHIAGKFMQRLREKPPNLPFNTPDHPRFNPTLAPIRQTLANIGSGASTYRPSVSSVPTSMSRVFLQTFFASGSSDFRVCQVPALRAISTGRTTKSGLQKEAFTFCRSTKKNTKRHRLAKLSKTSSVGGVLLSWLPPRRSAHFTDLAK
jgi:hypothetical protein